MLRAFLGKKIGMTHIFDDNGNVIPVTVVQAGPCTVTQVRTSGNDGYEAVQIGFGAVKRVNKPQSGHLKGQLLRHLKEVQSDDVNEHSVGDEIQVDMFDTDELVDVIGTSKGKGFAGTMKRHNFSGGDRTHGQSDRSRAPGSIGGGTTPGRVYKGQKMSGHMGNERITVKNLRIVKVDVERNLLWLKGAIPGAPNGLVTIRKTGKTAKVNG
jgi:large subunit ribosomal protein L3|tara:strand:- start:210 stop:842 length:633 start_codon:yes stop_codon:yes gene_type:complete